MKPSFNICFWPSSKLFDLISNYKINFWSPMTSELIITKWFPYLFLKYSRANTWLENSGISDSAFLLIFNFTTPLLIIFYIIILSLPVPHCCNCKAFIFFHHHLHHSLLPNHHLLHHLNLIFVYFLHQSTVWNQPFTEQTLFQILNDL